METLIQNLIRCGYTTFVAGGALGFDTEAAEYVLECRKAGLPVRLSLVLPCADQDHLWSPAQQERYRKIIDEADEVECLAEHYTQDCMYRRNRRMVAKSAACIAFCQKDSGGTAYTLRYAKDRGLSIYNIAEMADRL